MQLQNKAGQQDIRIGDGHEQTDTKKEQIFCRKIREQTRRQKRSSNQVAEQIYRSTEGEDKGKLKSC